MQAEAKGQANVSRLSKEKEDKSSNEASEGASLGLGELIQSTEQRMESLQAKGQSDSKIALHRVSFVL